MQVRACVSWLYSNDCSFTSVFEGRLLSFDPLTSMNHKNLIFACFNIFLGEYEVGEFLCREGELRV